MANTIIQIKRSLTTANPGVLQFGEFAYSFQSGKLFLGDQFNNAIAIAGNTYNQIIDAATSANTADTLVKRDSLGNFSATVISAELAGNAATATQWQTPRYLGVQGDASGQMLIDGTSDANLQMTLTTVNSDVGSFGSITQIPVFTVNEKGLITSASNTTISTTLNIAADTNVGEVNLLNETLTFIGGDGVTTDVDSANNSVSFEVDNTVIRTSGGQTIGGALYITGDLDVSGNTIFRGNTYAIDVEHYTVSDPIIYLAANNYTSDLVSIGFAANYFDGSDQLHTGFFRMPQTNDYYLFTGVTDELSANNEISPSANGFTRATIIANLDQGYVANLAFAVSATDGGTGFRSYTPGDLLYAANTTSLSKLSAVANGSVLLSDGINTSPVYGKVGLTEHVAGVLGIGNGGTNSVDTPTAGAVAYGDGSAIRYTGVGTQGQALMSFDGNAPAFGTLDLQGGGLGFTSPNANSVVFYGHTGNLMSYTNSATDGHVLQYSTSSGVQFGHLDGGNF